MESGGKKGSIKIFLVVTIIIVVMTIMVVLLFIWQQTGENPIKEVINQIQYIINAVGDNHGDSDSLSSSSSSTSSSSSSSSTGGGGGSSSSSSGDSECVREIIAYSLVNIKATPTCNFLQGSICTDKTVVCTTDVHNLDLISQGHFKIVAIFVEDGKISDQGFDSQSVELTIAPQDYTEFKRSTRITSEGEDGLANKQINCFFNTLENPYKEFC